MNGMKIIALQKWELEELKMLRKSRSEILEDFKAQVAAGKILVGVGAGAWIIVTILNLFKG